jgi:hypothetical protein
MTYAAKTAAEQLAIRNSLIENLKAVENSVCVNNPGLDAAVEVLLAELALLVNGAVGAGVATKAVVSNAQALVVPVTGVYATTATLTVAGGAVTAIVLS